MVEQSSYKLILDSLSTAVIVVDKALRVEHLNLAAESLLGVSSDHQEGKSLANSFHADEAAPHNLKKGLQEGKYFTKRQESWKLSSGHEITVDYTVTPAQEEGFAIIEIQALDRLLRISKEEAWISSQETSRNLVRSMAHEIKNPLGGIRGAAQLLSRELSTEDNLDLDEYTRIIIEETDRLRNLVDRMLGPRTPPEFKDVNIHEILEHVSSVVGLEVQGTVKILRDYDPSIPNICGDRTQLIQAFLNILGNAVEALTENEEQEDPTVVVSTRVHRRYTIGRVNYPLVVKVSMVDNGPGIPDSIIDDIFFPMITGRPGGSGLGLSISQNLIGQHQGLIECNSKPGRTEFAVYIPLGKQHV